MMTMPSSNAYTLSDDAAYALLSEMPDQDGGNLAEGDPYWFGVFALPNGLDDGFADLPGGFYGLESNNYGQNVAYRFASEADMYTWFDVMKSGLSD